MDPDLQLPLVHAMSPYVGDEAHSLTVSAVLNKGLNLDGFECICEVTNMADREPGIIREFRELYEYVRLMGEHINQIHARLERIERDMTEINASHRTAITQNAADLRTVREQMINKYELDDFVEKLKASVGEALPSLPGLVTTPAVVDETTDPATEG